MTAHRATGPALTRPKRAPSSAILRQMPLYRELIGPAWDGLGEALRRLHASDGPVRAAGQSVVEVGETRALRLLRQLLGFPAAADSAEIRLEILPEAGGERWRRRFGEVRVESWEERAGDLLAERFRGVELRFRLRVEGAGLRFEQTVTALRLGPLRLPLPARLAPRVEARDDPGHGPAEIRFAVRITLAGRRLLRYAGAVHVEVPS